MILLSGLGNPGQAYEKTRHNVGFWFIDEIAKIYSIPVFQKKFSSEFSILLFESFKILLIKPQTYMNNSGKAISEAAKFYKISNDNIIIVHDEIELPVGKIKIKQGGSSSGHNGLRSIDSLLGQDYWRIKIGIDRPLNKEGVSDYVLSKMEERDKLTVDVIIGILSNHLNKICEKNFQSLEEEIKLISRDRNGL
jgi:PTH1 family peptidyl-tRNA hydrolase